MLVVDTEPYAEVLGSASPEAAASLGISTSGLVRASVKRGGPLTATGGALAAVLRHRGANVMVLVKPAEVPNIHFDPVVHLAQTDTALSATATAGRRLVRAWSEQASHHTAELYVPKPNRSDAESLRAGLLTLDTQLGQALGVVARELCGLRIGLALGEGSAKGFAHLGVIRSLERAGLPCDRIAGTSIGAAVAALYAAGIPVDAAQAHLARVGSATFRPVLPLSSLMSNAGVARIMRAVWGHTTRIEDLPTPLAIVAADMVTGSEVVLKRGLLWAAALASISIPGIYPPQRMGERLLVDGGVVDPVPGGVVRSLGSDIVIAVRLSTRRRAALEEVEATAPSGRVPSVVHTILRSRDLMQGRYSASDREASVVIEPEFPPSTGLGLRDFGRGNRFVEIGEAAAEASLPLIAARVPWLAAARTP